jgi:hypothetical protein
MMVRQVVPAYANGFRIQIDHHDPLHRWVAQDFSERGALSSSAYEDGLGAGVEKHGRMHQRFVVDVLIHFSGLGLVIQHQAAAKGRGVKYVYGLVLGPACMYNVVDPVNRQNVGGHQLEMPSSC